jgi:hypothetical protein
MSGFYDFPTARHVGPSWSEPRVTVLSAEDAEHLSQQINILLCSAEFHVLAVSAATTTATFVEEPWVMTVVLQERTNPNEVTS